jgi:hypothetical protein
VRKRGGVGAAVDVQEVCGGATPVAANSKQYQGGLGARLGKQSGVEAERTTEKYMAVAQRQTAVLAKAGNGQNHPRRVRVPGSEAGD